jgi:hypothetical protein
MILTWLELTICGTSRVGGIEKEKVIKTHILLVVSKRTWNKEK